MMCRAIISGLTVATCPGATQCDSHGVCSSKTFRCACQATFTSGDCTLRTCPLGPSWFVELLKSHFSCVNFSGAYCRFSYPSADNSGHDQLVQCSNMGVCDPVTGGCACRSGFFGAACQYMSCNGAASGFPSCNSQGRCMSMQEMALWSTVNGVISNFHYGENPNNAYTWDGTRVYGCMCDPGFEGYDCSLMTCPAGDDPGTYDQHVEVQLIQCIADAGTFTLSFRNATSVSIHTNTTAAELRAILEAIPTLGPLSVFYTNDGDIPLEYISHNASIPYVDLHRNASKTANPTAKPTTAPTAHPTAAVSTGLCSSSGDNVALIQFDTVHGDLPALYPTLNNLLTGIHTGSVNVYTDGQTVKDPTYDNGLPRKFISIMGTTENAPCNNRGICDATTGTCKCFYGWSSSDGMGGPGFTGDCGYRSHELPH
jgi:hypothetical protein